MVGGGGGGGCGSGWSGVVGVDQNPWEINRNQLYSIKNRYFREISNQGFRLENIDFHHFLIDFQKSLLALRRAHNQS